MTAEHIRQRIRHLETELEFMSERGLNWHSRYHRMSEELDTLRRQWEGKRHLWTGAQPCYERHTPCMCQLHLDTPYYRNLLEQNMLPLAA